MSREKDADTVVYLASSPDVLNTTGQYFAKRKAVPPSREATDDASARKLWDVSAKLAGLAN